MRQVSTRRALNFIPALPQSAARLPAPAPAPPRTPQARPSYSCFWLHTNTKSRTQPSSNQVTQQSLCHNLGSKR